MKSHSKRQGKVLICIGRFSLFSLPPKTAFSECPQPLTGHRPPTWGAEGRRFKSCRPDHKHDEGQTLTGDLPFFVLGQLKTNSIDTQNPKSAKDEIAPILYSDTPAHPDDDMAMCIRTARSLAARMVERFVILAGLLLNTVKHGITRGGLPQDCPKHQILPTAYSVISSRPSSNWSFGLV